MSITELLFLGAFAVTFLLFGMSFVGYFHNKKKINAALEKNSKSLKTNIKSWESKISKNSDDFDDIQKRL